jgi:hypothetical protein
MLRCLLPALLFFALPASALPSGGPYGPVDQVYKIPKAAHVYVVAPDGDPAAAGTLKAPTTLAVAIGKAVTNDAIILRGGIYRTGSLAFNQRIVFQPYLGERPVLKGTGVADKWEAAGEHAWKTSWTKLFPAHPLAWWNRKKEEAKTPQHRFNNDMVFYDGEFLKSAGSVAELDAHSYYIDYAAQEVYIGADPKGHLVEITAHDGALIRTTLPVNGKLSDKLGPVIKGLTFTQYARRALEVEGKKQFGPDEEPTDEPVGLADPSTFGKEVTGTLLENVTITFASRVAGYFRGDGLVIRNSLVSDTGTEGIYVIGSSNVLLEKNVIRRNNIEKLTGYFASSVKIFNQTRHVVMRDNLVLDNPDSNGVWYDVGNRDGVFVNNYVAGQGVGFFFEISRGVTVAGNVFIDNEYGARILNSADARVYANTFLNSPVLFGRTERVAAGDTFNWHPSTGPDVDKRDGHVFVDNLMAAEDARFPLLRAEQAAVQCGKLKGPQLKQIDGNVYVRPAVPGGTLIGLAPVESADCSAAYASLADFRKAMPQYEAHGKQLDRSPRAVFQNADLGRLVLRQPLPAGLPLPAEVQQLMLNPKPAKAKAH